MIAMSMLKLVPTSLSKYLICGAERIAAERERQLKQGYGPAYDRANNSNSELLAAAACYIVAADPVSFDPYGDYADRVWPWSSRKYKPHEDDAVANLTIAGALIAAAIDELQQQSGT